MDVQAGSADRSAIEAQTHEFQRISAVGHPRPACLGDRPRGAGRGPAAV
jgi:hypothetical protein